MLENLTKANLAENLHTPFRLCEQPDQVMELVELREGRSTPRQDVFALVFRGSPDHILPQSIYAMEHSKLGRFDLFIVPVSQDQEGTFYEAVFNRLIDQEDRS